MNILRARPSPGRGSSGGGMLAACLYSLLSVGGFSATAQAASKAPNRAPVAVYSWSQFPGERIIIFAGAGSHDSDGTIKSFRWTYGDGAIGSGRNASHMYARPGTYTATFTVTDNAGSSTSATFYVTVEGAPNQPYAPPV